MEVRSIIKNHQFRFKKSLGQNFITDNSLLQAIVRDAEITKEDTVVEIGTGAGTLTRALAEQAKRVISFDVDSDLQPILQETLAGLDNVEVIFRDVLKMKDDEFREIVEGKFKVVANLPYYITTPLIMRFLESELPVETLTVMVQKEVADRLTAKENTAEYGSITVSIRFRADVSITRIVGRQLFHPQPNVDSAVVNIKLREKYAVKDKKLLLRLIKSGFAMRRKTLVNNLSMAFSISKDEAKETLQRCGFDERIRGEVLSVEEYITLSENLAQILQEKQAKEQE